MGTATAAKAWGSSSTRAASGLTRLGGWSACVVTVLLVGEVAVYVTWRRPDSVADHLAVLQDNWLIGLLTLDLLGMIAYPPCL